MVICGVIFISSVVYATVKIMSYSCSALNAGINDTKVDQNWQKSPTLPTSSLLVWVAVIDIDGEGLHTDPKRLLHRINSMKGVIRTRTVSKVCEYYVTMCVYKCLLQQFLDCITIGRDLIRLLQNVSRLVYYNILRNYYWCVHTQDTSIYWVVAGLDAETRETST